MSFFSQVWRDREEVITIFHLALLHAMFETENRCRARGKKPEEPDFVASLVLESTPFVHEALSALFARHMTAVSVASVFCHQSPKVKFAGVDETVCELGDLLIVHSHTDSLGVVTRGALLYQAKRTPDMPHRVKKPEYGQLLLYTKWPDFEYVSPMPLTGQKRRVGTQQPHQGAQYLLIDGRPFSDPLSSLRKPWKTFPLRSCMADEWLYCHNFLPEELFDFLLLRSGRAFEDQHASKGKGDWSEMVWDLLRVGLTKAFNRRGSGRISAPRQGGASLEELDGSSFFSSGSSRLKGVVSSILGDDRASFLFAGRNDEPPNDFRRDPVGHHQDQGVSLIIIESEQEEGGEPHKY